MENKTKEELLQELEEFRREDLQLTEEFNSIIGTGNRQRNGEITVRQSIVRAASKKIIAELAKRD